MRGAMWGRAVVVFAVCAAATLMPPSASAAASTVTWGTYDVVTFGEMGFGPDGSLYTSDCGNARIYRVSSSGVVSVFAGAGPGGFDNGYSGDGGPALEAHFGCPVGLAFDAAGNLYVADHLNDVIRRIDPAGIVTTVAGVGPVLHWWPKGQGAQQGMPKKNGDGGPATQAILDKPWGIAFDAAGSLYIADREEEAIRKVDTDGIISTVAGTGRAGYNGDGIAAVDARLNRPIDVAFDAAGNLLITDEDNLRIRRVNARGVISTVAGNGASGCGGDGGPATAASFSDPNDVVLAPDGSLLVDDNACARVRRFRIGGSIQAFAGTGVPGCAGYGGPASAMRMNGVSLRYGPNGDLYMADQGCGVIVRVDGSGRTHLVATAPAT
jgi:hypothetical protein